MPKQFTLQFDGGSRGNPGPAGIGFVILKAAKPIFAVGRFAGTCTNNVAEYTALIAGLEKALSLGIKSLEVRGDSELVIRQMLGIYRVKHPDLQQLHARASELASQIGDVGFIHNLRHHNSLADELANRAMDLRREVVHIGSIAEGESSGSETCEGQGKATMPKTSPITGWVCPVCDCVVHVVKQSALLPVGPLTCTCGTAMAPK